MGYVWRCVGEKKRHVVGRGALRDCERKGVKKRGDAYCVFDDKVKVWSCVKKEKRR